LRLLNKPRLPGEYTFHRSAARFLGHLNDTFRSPDFPFEKWSSFFPERCPYRDPCPPPSTADEPLFPPTASRSIVVGLSPRLLPPSFSFFPGVFSFSKKGRSCDAPPGSSRFFSLRSLVTVYVSLSLVRLSHGPTPLRPRSSPEIPFFSPLPKDKLRRGTAFRPFFFSEKAPWCHEASIEFSPATYSF